MRTKIALVVLAGIACLGQPLSAQQSLNVALFERYVVLLREQLAIPGLSGAIVQGGRVVWANGFGHANLAASIPARADTPYPVLGLSQAVSSSLLLQQCVDFGHLELTDSVRRWVPDFPDASLTVSQLLSHRGPAGYAYDPSRFAVVSDVLKQCANAEYTDLLASRVLSAFAMIDSIPAAALAAGHPAYQAILQRVATPYDVDERGRATPAPFVHPPANGATGLISSALDLAQFDVALRNGLLASPPLLGVAWTPVAGGPTGLGWFVQRVDSATQIGSDIVVWQYGLAPGAYSSVMIKVPGRDLTLVLLANSDRLTAPLASEPDIRLSVFARLFFRIFLA